ncbi:MAG: chemotaxis protein CheW [Leptolyngbyaceae cyanobacterium CRU_2_3]|nr:chemotaxis protein CheW [Leptolyngbyaceae cyanobacterium CRU_2_3]
MTTTAAAENNHKKTQQFLSFFMLPQIHAILPAQQLTEILSLAPQQIVPIPDVPSQVMGVCNWRGEVLWLLDLGCFMGTESLSSQKYRQSNYSAIVVHHQDCTLGLVVDRVSHMLWCDPEQIQSIPTPHHKSATSPCLQGYWLSPQGETFLVLDGQVLINAFRNSSE